MNRGHAGLRALSHQRVYYGRALVECVQRLHVYREPQYLLRRVAEKFRVSVDDIKGRSRKIHVAMARTAACYLLRQNTSMTYHEIGNFLGGRDHSTIIHSVQVAEKTIQHHKPNQTINKPAESNDPPEYLPWLVN